MVVVALVVPFASGMAWALAARSPAIAPTPDPEIIYACYVPASGTVYRIKTPGGPQACHDSHTEFSWNAEGPQGPAGPEGPAGPAGISGYQIVEEEWSQFPHTVVFNDINCPVGKKVLGGGFSGALLVGPSTVEWNIRHSRPSADGTAWTVAIQNTINSVTATFKGFAVCANIDA
jgi:hypothetical protein